MKRLAFDFFGTLTDHEGIREIARTAIAKGHEVHIVSAIDASIAYDYSAALFALQVPFTAVHRTAHDPNEKVAVLRRLEAIAFWDDFLPNVIAARSAGFLVCHAGVDPPTELRRFIPRQQEI